MKYVSSILFFLFLSIVVSSQDLIPFQKDTLWGYRDQQGIVKIEPGYQYANKYVGNYAVVAKENQLGAIDKNAQIIIPFHYEYLRSFDPEHFLFGYRAEYFGEYVIGIMTKNEKIILPAEFSHIYRQRNTYVVSRSTNKVLSKGNLGDVYTNVRTSGLYDSVGKVIIPSKYDNIVWATDSVLVVDSAYNSSDGKLINTRSALFSPKGEQLTGFEYMVFGKFIDGIAKARIDNKFGFIYPSGKIAIPIQFDYCEEFNNGFAIIKEADKWGAIDKKGKIIIVPIFNYDEVKAKLLELNGL